MKKNNQLAAIIVVGLIIVVGAYYYFAAPPAAPVPSEAATTTPVASTPAAPAAPTATKYANPQLGFSFMMPVDSRGTWKVTEADATHVSFVIDIPDYGGESNLGSMVAVNVNTGHLTLAALKDAEQRKNSGEVAFLGIKDFSLSGEPAFIEQFDGMAPVDYVFTIHKGYVYELSGVIADLVYDTGDQSGFTFTR